MGLPECQWYERLYNAILIVVDRLTKKKIYILYSNKDDGTNTKVIAKMLVQHVWSKHGLPTSVVSNQGPQFVSKIWKSLCEILKIKAKLSTAFHLKTDGQSKVANQKMERHLHSYVNHFQDNWIDLLPMIEFATNTNMSAIIKIALFMVTKGYIS